jgi:hypothetical protein
LSSRGVYFACEPNTQEKLRQLRREALARIAE